MNREELLALADKVERYRMPTVVPTHLYFEIGRERKTQILCRALCEHEGFDPDEVTDPVTLRLRWRDYEGHLRALDNASPSRISVDEMAAALRLRAMSAASGIKGEAGDAEERLHPEGESPAPEGGDAQ